MMKPSRSLLPRVLTRSIAGLIVTLTATSAAKAQTVFTWSNAAGGAWPTGTNWAGGVVANGAGNIADFSTLDITAARTVNLDGARTIGGLKFGDSNNTHDWTLATGSAGPLTLDPTSGLAIVEVTNRVTNISAVLAGNEGLQKEGAGTLRISGANTITGDLIVNNGVLQLGNNAAINGFSSVINVNANAGIVGGNGTTLVIFDNTNIGAGRTVNLNSGSGNLRTTLMGQNNGIWQGDVVISGASPAAINATAGTFTINGNVTGSAGGFFARGAGTGVMNGNINVGNLFVKTDGGTWILNTTGHTWLNATQIADGQLQLGVTDALLTTLPIVIGQGSATNGRFELNGFNQSVPGLRTDPASTGTNHIVRNSNVNIPSNLTVSVAEFTTDTMRNTHFQGAAQGIGSLTLTKQGDGRLEFQEGRYDHANIAINAGTVAFTGNNNVTIRANITGASAAVFEKFGINTTTVYGAFNNLGLTTVADGRLSLGAGNSGTISVADNATLGAGVGGGLLAASALSFGSFGETTFAPTLGTPGGASFVNATSLSVGGTGTRVIFDGANITPGTYPILSYGGGAIGGLGFAGFSLGAVGTYPHATVALVNNPGASRIELNVTAVDSLTWTGTNSNAWDINTAQNFKLASSNAAAAFYQGDRVLFDDTGLNRGIAATGGIRVGNLNFNHTAGLDYAVMGVLSGPGSITKAGTGTTGLNGIGVSSIFGDGTTVTVVTTHDHGFTSGQQVTISNSNVAGYNATATVTVIDATTFTYANTNTAGNTSGSVTAALANTGSTFTGPIAVTGGVLILGGSNPAHGAVSISGGTLRLANANAISSGAPVTISNGGTLDVNGQAPNLRVPSIHVSGAGVDGNGAIVNTGAAITNLNHALEITLDGDTTWGGTGRYDVNATTRFNGGNFTLTKVGTNEMWYTPAAGSTLGNVVVNSGTFGVQSNNPLATTSTVTINVGAFHTIFSAVNLQHPAVINDGGTLRSNSGAPVFNGSVTLGGLAANQFMGATGTNTLNIAGKITGQGGFTKNDTGTVQIRNSANDYLGDTIVSNGTLNFSTSGALPATTNLIVDGGTFDPSNLTHTVASISGGGGVIGQGTANVGVIVTTQATDTMYLGQVNRALIRMNGTGSLTLGGVADNSTGTAEVNSGTLILAKTGTLDVHGVGAGGVGLKINAGGTVKLGGPQSGGGTGSNVPPAGAPANYVDQVFNLTDVVMTTGGVFDLSGFSEALDGLTGGGTIRTSVVGTANSRLYVGYGNTNGQFTGVIENGGGVVELEKLGTGTLLLNGVNTYTGSTTVTAGAFANVGSLATNGLVAANGTTLFSPGAIAGGVTLNGNAYFVGTGAIGGSVSLNATSVFVGGGSIGAGVTLGGTSVFSSNGAITGAVTLNGGIFNGGGNITGSLTANNGSTINVGGTAVATISTGSLTFPATATRTLNIGLSSTAADRINSTSANGLTLDGTTNIVAQPGAGGWVTGSYPILGYNGAIQGAGVGSLVLQNTGGHSTLAIVDNGAGTISLQVTGVAVKWAGGNGNTWDTNTTLNWTSPDQLFLTGDAVRLDDTATSFTPTINANVSPSAVTFDTGTSNYILSGTAGIASGSLWKTGTGTVRITNPNTYAGPTGVQQGTLSAVYASGIVPIAAASTIGVSTGATFNPTSANVDFTLANTITGLGTVKIDPNNGGTAGNRQVTLTSNFGGFTGKVLLSPTVGGGTFRVPVDNGLDFGLSTVEVDDGGQIFVNTAGLVFPNAFVISGTGYSETAGSLGAIRSSNTVFTGPITVEGSAKIGALGSTATFTGAISGGDLTFGGSNNSSAETMVITGNAGGLTSLTINDGLATGNAQTITVSVGEGGTSGSIGAVPVTLVGDGFKTSSLRFDRSNGYALGGSITSIGASNRTDVQIDTLGAGFNSNGQDISLGSGTFRVGVSRTDAVATINSALSAGTITVGALNTAISTKNAT
ncbi:MAG TPA: autotransporter-associated beta strand repeat-containing protein, partial [Chthoniobacteraceae bacterium]|nr:autotransporter-associated beta strand repeat-containing protein [Chthoniobacteraceae bacterium]